ncbi:MAG: caspase family protein [Muribaculaceae bacterium]|nr:caspase family protein [Muribaculaceae bacterium]
MLKRFILLIAVGLFLPLMTVAVNRALLVGIGKYDREKTGWNVIHGDADVELLRPMLAKRGFSDIVTLTNDQATKRAIVDGLASLASRCQPGDKVYFHFSGHGQPIRDDNRDEKTVRRDKKYDEAIIPYDACRDRRKMGGTYIGQYHLIDDELAPLLDAIKCKVGKTGEVFVAIDACYSKGIQKDELTDLDPELLKYVRGTDIAFTPPGRKSFVAGLPKPKKFTPGAPLIIVTACQENERNFECRTPSGKMYGALSYYIYTLLKKDADFGRWRRSFEQQDYKGRGIFQTIQHPSIEVIP